MKTDGDRHSRMAAMRAGPCGVRVLSVTQRDRGKSTTCETLGVPALCTGCALVNGAAHASPPYGLRSPTRAAGRAVHPRLPLSKCSRYVLSCPARTSSLPLRHRSHRMPALHAEGRLSPRPARREIRRRNPDVGAPRPSRRRLRYLAHAPSRSAALRRLLHRPRVSCPASGSADGRRAAPPPRQRERLAARRPEDERLSLLPNSAISIPRRMRRASWTWSAFSHADTRSADLTARTNRGRPRLLKGSADFLFSY